MDKLSAMPALGDLDDARGRGICAVIVAYYPDEELEFRLPVLLQQVEALLVVDNTPIGVCRKQLMPLSQRPGMKIVENNKNIGIAAALNQGLEHARTLGCTWLLTLDQDTRCDANMVDILLRTYVLCNQKPAVIGSNYLDPQLKRLAIPAPRKPTCLERKTVITSGSLINVKIANEVGGFRADYFIDQVDHEFCLRMRTRGHRVVISGTPTMTHSVGTSGGVTLPFLGTQPNHPPSRKYYIARNSIVTVATYWRQEPAWCLRRLVRLVLGLVFMAVFEKQAPAKTAAFMAGCTDAIRGRMGPRE